VRTRSRRGSNAVEFALTLPVLCALGAGVIDLGQFLWYANALVSAVSDGARAGSIVDTKVTSATTTATSVTLADWNNQGLGGTPTLKVSVANNWLTVSGTIDVPPLFGFLPLPTSTTYSSTVRLAYP
jgi:Flp pilus assembly protein TadG